MDFFTANGGGNYTNKPNIKIETVNQTLKIWLTNEDLKEAERITKLIEAKITH